VHDIAVLHDILLAFQAHLARFSSTRFAFAGDVIVIGDDLARMNPFSKSVWMTPAA